ncbi:MAG: gliding motility lipoprotein GldJ [Flavobacteriales bacterium]|jgi:gliding motility-associated lipoprotein GldJ|nr:gliding motility lipoprotein GldJ [Flavobacteriales bacterium]MBT7481754.1 gliding motility lipoprotein GldJ [Flavobacteriales bacterium]
MIKKNSIILAIAGMFIFASCSQQQSSTRSGSSSTTTGWKYNTSKNGGFQVDRGSGEQILAPGLVFVEGGSFSMGRVEQDVMYDWNNIAKKVTVSSFYIDETEVRNVDYLEYLYWLNRVYGATYPEVYKKALPDTLVWRDKLGNNETFVNNYLRHPSFKNYPVVGVSWEQANNYCVWRTDRVNERILINAGILKEDFEQADDNTFNTEAYLSGQYEGIVGRNLKNLNPINGDETRRVRREDGILLPNYRLPTEAEWEFAALGYVGNTDEENINERKVYPWNGSSVRNGSKQNQGQIMANFKRGRGDNMGVAGNLNDNADITGPVTSFWPNDYGLFNMAGNVSEWVLDVYRPVVEQTSTSDHRPFRGNVFSTQETDEDGFIAEKDEFGKIKTKEVDPTDNIYRRNYKKSDNINYLDGDIESQMGIEWNNELDEEGSKDKATVEIDKWNKEASKYENDEFTSNSNEMYDYGNTSLITDRTRVYKGGSWKDRAYWLNPGTRRFLDQALSSDAIGFRCAMDRVGSPVSNQRDHQRRETDYSKKKN